MSSMLSMTCLLVTISNVSSNIKSKKLTIFKDEHVIFSSSFNITKLLVVSDGSRYILNESRDIPPIFFTISDPNLEGGSCIYLLEGVAAYEILEGGRDSTSDYGQDTTIYFGTYRGIYKLIQDSLTTIKFGPFYDDIIQLQKAKDLDVIYILNADHKLYKVENNGTKRARVENVVCALEFVLDTANNIYYKSCDDHMPRILRTDGNELGVMSSLVDLDVGEIRLIRPAFIMEQSIPLFGGNNLYLLLSNGTSEKKDLFLDNVPSAFTVDAGLYIVAAMNGKIYEFNVMDMLLRSMLGLPSDWLKDVIKIVMSFIETAKDHIGYLGKN